MSWTYFLDHVHLNSRTILSQSRAAATKIGFSGWVALLALMVSCATLYRTEFHVRESLFATVLLHHPAQEMREFQLRLAFANDGNRTALITRLDLGLSSDEEGHRSIVETKSVLPILLEPGAVVSRDFTFGDSLVTRWQENDVRFSVEVDVLDHQGTLFTSQVPIGFAYRERNYFLTHFAEGVPLRVQILPSSERVEVKSPWSFSAAADTTPISVIRFEKDGRPVFEPLEEPEVRR